MAGGLLQAGRAVAQERENRWEQPRFDRREEPLPRPPLPVTMPAITPVAQLKNDVTMRNEYSPEAAQQLYDTPTYIRFGDTGTDRPREHVNAAQQGARGFYTPDPVPDSRGNMYNIEITGNDPTAAAGDYGSNEATLTHEFAHARYNDLPDELAGEWVNNYRKLANPFALSRVAQSYSNEWAHGPETYAFTATLGPDQIPPDVRNRFYPGTYREDASAYNPSVPERPGYQMRPDEPYSFARGGGYSTEFWPNEPGVRGYYEDGSPINAPVFPLSWNTPRWPSFGLLRETSR